MMMMMMMMMRNDKRATNEEWRSSQTSQQDHQTPYQCHAPTASHHTTSVTTNDSVIMHVKLSQLTTKLHSYPSHTYSQLPPRLAHKPECKQNGICSCVFSQWISQRSRVTSTCCKDTRVMQLVNCEITLLCSSVLTKLTSDDDTETNQWTNIHRASQLQKSVITASLMLAVIVIIIIKSEHHDNVIV